MGAILIDRWPSDGEDAVYTSNNNAGARWGATNLQRYTLDKAYRSDSVSATAQIILDMGSLQDLTAFAMAGHNILETDTMLLEYADSTGFFSPHEIDLTWSAGIIWVDFTTEPALNKRAMRLTITKTSASDYIQIGRMVTGPHTELSVGLKTPGDADGVGKTTSTDITTVGGQKYGTIGAALKVLPGTFPPLDADDIAELEFIKETYQDVVPFFMIIRNGQALENAFYGTLDSVSAARYATPELRGMPWSMTEQK